MLDRIEQIANLIREIEADAFDRGVRAGVNMVKMKFSGALEAADASLRGAVTVTEPPVVQAPRGRPPKSIALVREAIGEKPGMTGVEIVRALSARGTPVLERTVRTCLRRLREHKVIWKRQERWYPRPQDTENAKGEALETPPH